MILASHCFIFYLKFINQLRLPLWFNNFGLNNCQSSWMCFTLSTQIDFRILAVRKVPITHDFSLFHLLCHQHRSICAIVGTELYCSSNSRLDMSSLHCFGSCLRWIYLRVIWMSLLVRIWIRYFPSAWTDRRVLVEFSVRSGPSV